MKKHARFLGFRVSAIVEMILMFLILIGIAYIFDVNDRFWSVWPHPCWIIILLMVAQYGSIEAILAAILSSLYLLVGNMPERGFDASGDIYEYLFIVMQRPTMWIIAAVVLGELVGRHIRKRRELCKSIEESREREQKISDSYEKVKSRKQNLELQIAGQMRSSLATYNAAKSLESLDPADIASGVEELVRSVINPEKFSLFTLNGDVLEADMISGWTSDQEYRAEITSDSELYREVIGNREVLCIANDVHERKLDGQGVLAGPLLDMDSGQVLGMLKIESLPYSDMNLSTVESFRAVCEWVGTAFANAAKYQKAKSESVVNPDHNLFTTSYFKRHTEYVTALAKRAGFNVSMITVKLIDGDKMSAAERRNAAKQLSRTVEGTLRTVDLAFDYQDNAEEYSVVLPTTDKAGARIVLAKIEKGLNDALGNEVRFAFSVHAIHEK